MLWCCCAMPAGTPMDNHNHIAAVQYLSLVMFRQIIIMMLLQVLKALAWATPGLSQARTFEA